MVAGLSGLGKTTTCNLLFESWQQPDKAGRRSPLARGEPRLRKTTRHVDVSRRIERYDADANTILRVRVVDTPGFGNNIDHKHAVRPITKYVRRCRDEQFRAQMAARSQNDGAEGDRLVRSPRGSSSFDESRRGGSVETESRVPRGSTRGDESQRCRGRDVDVSRRRVAATPRAPRGRSAETGTPRPRYRVETSRTQVHACIYFISPHRFLEIDRHFLRHVQRELAIVPVIAKSDTLTDEELSEYRAMLVEEFRANGVARRGTKRRGAFKMHARPSGRSRGDAAGRDVDIPRSSRPDRHRAGIAVCDFDEKSASILGDRAFARGRKRGEPLGIIARDGHYPWGTSEVHNGAHSDFALLRELLLSEHTEALVEHAAARYATYRARRVRVRRLTDFLKSATMLAVALRAAGVPVPGPTRSDVTAAFSRVAAAVLARWNALTASLTAPPAPAPPPPPRQRRFPLFPASVLRGGKHRAA